VSELLRAIKSRWPETPLYLSTVTATGQETAASRLGDVVDELFYLPFDLPPVVSRVVDRVNPQLFLVVETELWPGLITAMGERNIPQVLVNGRLSPGSFRNYHAFRALMGALLCKFHRLCMQSRRDAARMVALGAPEDKVTFTGNLKYDTIIASLAGVERQAVRKELGIPAQSLVVVAGSTHPGEEDAMLKVLEHCQERIDAPLVLLLAPRHPERWDEVAGLLEERGVGFMRRSGGRSLGDTQVLLLDTLGELARTYAAADLAFVGGSLAERGGHNPLEPAALGVPVVMGPHLYNFQEISQLLKESGGLLVCRDQQELLEACCMLLKNGERRKEMGKQGRAAVFRNRGAQERTLRVIEEALDHPKAQQQPA